MVTQLQQVLPVLIYFPCAKLTEAGWPGVVISTHSGVEIAKNKQRFLFWVSVDESVKTVVELVLGLCRGSQRSSLRGD